MESQPSAAGTTGQPVPQAYQWPPPPQPGQPRPRIIRDPRLPVRARASRRVVIAIIIGGVLFDVAGRSPLASISVTVWIIAAAGAIVLTGRVRGRAGRMCAGAAAVLAVLLSFRTSPWVTIPVVLADAGLLLLAASLGADGGGLSTTFPELAARTGVAASHVVLGPGILQRSRVANDAATKTSSAAISRLIAVGAGLLVLLVVGALLGAADPVFGSWLSLAALPRHLILVIAGGWIVAGLIRAASAARPSPALPGAPKVGVAETAFVLAGLCALYAAFGGAQLVTLSGAGHRILVTHGLTYARYARSGFFELLACAAITLLVLLGARAFASRENKLLVALSALTIVLTIGIVIVAIRRLELYEAAYGLTMLRLACLAAAAWIGLVLIMLGGTLLRRGLPGRAFPAAFLSSGLVLLAVWGAANPASIVATTNIRRAEQGHALDARLVAGLGPDAVPAIAAGLGRLRPAQASLLRSLLCHSVRPANTGTSFNVSAAEAGEAMARACG
jgi:two-component system sensor histidine kinase BaeS